MSGVTVDEAAENRGTALAQPDSRLPADLMRTLSGILAEAQPVPRHGTEASAAMRACFDRVASDIRNLGADHVRRAEIINQEAASFASMVEKAGDVLCAQIEREAVRGYKISKALDATRQMVEETGFDEVQGGEEPPSGG